MKFSLDKEDQYCVFNLEEKNLNSVIAPKLKSEFIFLRNEGVPNLILDLHGLEYVDSSGLSAILTANRLWKDDGQFIVAAISDENVHRIIKISRLDTILNIVDTVEEAKQRILDTSSTDGEG